MDLPQTAQAAPVFFTIVSANYMAYAKTLMASIREHHPDSRRYVFLADETTQDLNIEPGLFELRLAKDLPIPHFQHLAFRYNILEFNTALKPFVFSQLMREHAAAHVLYIDPDILLVAPLAEVFGRLSAGAMAVLTPHFTAPLEDGKSPDELAISRVGSFNLGFLATGPQPARKDFIDWWCRKLEFGAYVDLESGMFTDQKWMDLVPGMFAGVQILRHPGYNLAYWNLPHRPVSVAQNGTLLAAGEPVAFIHFSGVDVHHPEIFSKHQNRFDIRNIGALRPTYERYVALLQANGYDEYLKIGYHYGKLRDGTRITQEMREIFRQKFDIGCASQTSDPFGMPASAFVEPLPLSTRAMRWARKQFAQMRNFWPVRVLFNRLSPEARWALRRLVMRGVQSPQARAARQVATQRALGFAMRRAEGDTPLGARFIGYFKGDFGVAENARIFAAAARQAGVHLQITTLEADRPPVDEQPETHSDASVNVIFANAEQTPHVSASLGPAFREKYRIGYWFWELSEFPDAWLQSYDDVDEIWVATDFIREAVARRTFKPVHKVRPPVVVDLGRTFHRSDFGLPEDRFIFLFSFDYKSFAQRKNPYDTVTAFIRAFPKPDSGAILYIKSINSQEDPASHQKLIRAVGVHPNIIVHDEVISRGTMFGLQSVADAYVSLHRAEGFGLGLAECMALGKPVIATGYSGNLEFMNASNSCLVGYRLIPVLEGEYLHGTGKMWAQPDIEQAIFHMRRLVSDRTYAQALGKTAATHMRAEFNVAACGTAVRNRLAAISGQLMTAFPG